MDDGVASILNLLRAGGQIETAEILTPEGIARSELFRAHKTDPKLFEEAFATAGRELTSQLAAVTDGPPSARLVVRLNRYFDFAEKYAIGWLGILSDASPITSPGIRAMIAQVRTEMHEMVYREFRITEPTPMMEIVVRGWVAGVKEMTNTWLRTRYPDRADMEPLLSAELGMKLFAAAAYDPVVLDRMRWWMDAEPADGPWAAHLRSLAEMFDMPLAARMAELAALASPAQHHR